MALLLKRQIEMNCLRRLITLLMLSSFSVYSQELTYEIILKNHLFYPSELTIPANTKIKLRIHNQDNLPEEFDSFDLNREKVIFAGQTSTIFIGPLTPGKYQFFGEFNPNTAVGTIIVQRGDHAN